MVSGAGARGETCSRPMCYVIFLVPCTPIHLSSSSPGKHAEFEERDHSLTLFNLKVPFTTLATAAATVVATAAQQQQQ
ncbi:unnamed protein product [Onchocerca ochengi]|uniref:Secreted protein n=1 Tax=Onchocerca ochengi TaxID=42157 RepID=A0A182EDW1_ONCOC|nr:unnamed protein product [Onchocerca ochengi]